MKLSSIFFGAALVWGGLAAPGTYYQVVDEDATVRAKVLGKVLVEDDPVHSYRRYDVYTTQGKFNTYRIQNGDQIQTGASYEFNLRGGKTEFWPPSFSRTITGLRPLGPG